MNLYTLNPKGAYLVSPSNSVDLPRGAVSVYCGGAGALKVTTISGDVVTFSGVPAGGIIPIQCNRIWADSTCTLIMAFTA